MKGEHLKFKMDACDNNIDVGKDIMLLTLSNSANTDVGVAHTLY